VFLARTIRSEKETKGVQMGKEDVKLYSQNILELLIELDKITGHKIGVQKSILFLFFFFSILFLYICLKQYENDIKISATIAAEE
jgi:hypothetical protein